MRLSTLLFLSCIAVLQDFSSYQSDGMLLEAGFISIFFAPRGLRPGLGAADPPSQASLFMLRWEWFRIYFESGIAKLASGDVALAESHGDGRLLPERPAARVARLVCAAPAALVSRAHGRRHARRRVGARLGGVSSATLSRRVLRCRDGLQLGIIATANYAFLNYLVLVLGVLLLDDEVLARVRLKTTESVARPTRWPDYAEYAALAWRAVRDDRRALSGTLRERRSARRRALLAPFRIANPYGLFASMTEARYEIEFQGSSDGGAPGSPYPFRYKPQDVTSAPGIYAPYQPRFEWNLWFASLGRGGRRRGSCSRRNDCWSEARACSHSSGRDPFDGMPPTHVRTVLWQYWFTDLRDKARDRRVVAARELGPFAGVVTRGADGRIVFSERPVTAASFPGHRGETATG